MPTRTYAHTRMLADTKQQWRLGPTAQPISHAAPTTSTEKEEAQLREWTQALSLL